MNAQLELDARIAWTLARIGETVNAGRDAGWLPGRRLEVGDSDACLEAIAAIDGEPTPIQRIASRLALRDLEVDALWLLACVELDPHVAHAAQALVFPGMHELSAQMIERLVARAGTLAPGLLDGLHRLGLVEWTLDERMPLHRRAVRASDRVLDAARGEFDLDRSLRDVAILETELDVRRRTAGITAVIPDPIRAAAAMGRRLVVAVGAEGSGRSTVLRRAIAASERSVLTIRATELAREPARLAAQLRAIARECRLHMAAPLLCNLDAIAEVQPMVDRQLISVLDGPAFATARETVECSLPIPVVSVRAGELGATARAAAWRRALPAAAPGVIDECAHRYAVPPGLIGRAAESAVAMAPTGDIQVAHVHAGLRAYLEREVASLARRIETRQTWNDLVLPVDQVDLLIELVARVRRREQVLDQWGFADKVGRGIGTAALLSGPPGTGKTMIAGLVARELGLDLYQVDLSKIVSKYVGETEKQLGRLFDAADHGQAILLFDEADSLFAKRTEVKSSNDRYANLEVNYLLQRMEAFAGITLLTTNHETAIDPAFLRRLAFHIRVPMPEHRERELLWRSMLPSAAPVVPDLEMSGLAGRFEMSGGYIRNAALRAAFIAADEGSAITIRHLERAAMLEYEAMGKIA